MYIFDDTSVNLKKPAADNFSSEGFKRIIQLSLYNLTIIYIKEEGYLSRGFFGSEPRFFPSGHFPIDQMRAIVL